MNTGTKDDIKLTSYSIYIAFAATQREHSQWY